VTATNKIHSEILRQLDVSVMAVVGTNHMDMSKVAKPSKWKLVHSLLPWGSIVDSLWSSPPCVVDEFCYSVTSVKGTHIQLTAVNNVKFNKHIPVTHTVYKNRNFIIKQVLLV
jgi:hypothetical protein